MGDVEKNLEEYKRVVEIKGKQISDAKKILISAKQSYCLIVAENKELKAYKENLKQQFQSYQQQQQANFFEQQKNHYQRKSKPAKYKKVVYKEETDIEAKIEEGEEEYSENEIEKEPEEKKQKQKKEAAVVIIFLII